MTSTYRIRVSYANMYTTCGDVESFMFLGRLHLTLGKVWIMAVTWLFVLFLFLFLRLGHVNLSPVQPEKGVFSLFSLGLRFMG